MKDTTYGKKGGMGPTAGKKAIKYNVALPDGTILTKRVFISRGDGALVATGYIGRDGKPRVCVWPDNCPAWEGDFGRLVATPAP